MDGDCLVVVQDDPFVRSTIDVGRREGFCQRGPCDPVHVVLHLLDTGGRAIGLWNNGVLIRVLRRVRVDQRPQSRRTIAGVFIPLVIRVQARANQELEDLVGSGLGPPLAR